MRKSKKVFYIPKGYHAVTPYLIFKGAVKAIDFYKKVFGAKEVLRMEHNGKVGHAELMIGDAKIMLADEYPKMNARSPKYYGGSPVGIHVYVKDVDNIVKKASVAKAKIVMAPQDMFYGDRCASIIDPFGHTWHVATHIEDISAAELKKRGEAMSKEKLSNKKRKK